MTAGGWISPDAGSAIHSAPIVASNGPAQVANVALMWMISIWQFGSIAV